MRREELFGLPKVIGNNDQTHVNSCHLALSSRNEVDKSFTHLLKKHLLPEAELTTTSQKVEAQNTSGNTEYSDLINKNARREKDALFEENTIPTSNLPQPPPLVKIVSSSTTSIAGPSGVKWDSPQNCPQDLSMNNVKITESTFTSKASDTPALIKRAPIIVSPKKAVTQPISEGGTSTDICSESSIGRSPGKSVIVCHRPSMVS